MLFLCPPRTECDNKLDAKVCSLLVYNMTLPVSDQHQHAISTLRNAYCKRMLIVNTITECDHDVEVNIIQCMVV